MRPNDYSDFTEHAYAEMLRTLKAAGYSFARFAERPRGRHALLRHDVDYSMHRAVRIAEIEAEEQVVSTYFLMVRSRFYSLAEPETAKLVSRLLACGHDVGLHFDGEIYDTSHWSAAELEGAIARERHLLEVLIDREVDSVTFHNPDLSNLMTFRDETVGGLINGYSARLSSDYVYASDSNGYWRYEPMPNVIRTGHERLYLLTHPEWWTPTAMSPAERIDRAIMGRALANQVHYDRLLEKAGRKNVGRAANSVPAPQGKRSER
jgi:hypothetical protein